MFRGFVVSLTVMVVMGFHFVLLVVAEAGKTVEVGVKQAGVSGSRHQS